MFFARSFILFLCSFLILACASETVKQENTKPLAAQEVNASDLMLAQGTLNKPGWVDKPELFNHLAAVGSSAIKNVGGDQAQYLAAMEQAQARLNILFKKQPGNAERELPLHKAIVKDEWRHPETGRLYLWLILPK